VQDLDELLVLESPMPSSLVPQYLDCIDVVFGDPRKEELVIRVDRRWDKMEVMDSPVVQEMVVEERAMELALKGRQIIATPNGGDEVRQLVVRVDEFSRTMNASWSTWNSMPLDIQHGNRCILGIRKVARRVAKGLQVCAGDFPPIADEVCGD
jgi:hypothetical protein